jgi:hypothetical protein
VPMKRFVLALLVLAAGAALTGCDGITVTPVKPSDNPSVSLTDIAGPTTAPAPPPPSQPPVEALPASWTLCQNPISGFSIGYPSDWYTTSFSPSDACGLFDPDPFTIPAGDSLTVAVHAFRSPMAAQPPAFDPAQFTTILSEPTTAGGRTAYRFEVVSLGVPLISAGTRIYGYIIDSGGKAFTVETTAVAGDPRYNNWKAVVDTAVGTLKFDH